MERTAGSLAIYAWDDYNLFPADDAPPRPLSLIFFSLGLVRSTRDEAKPHTRIWRLFGVVAAVGAALVVAGTVYCTRHTIAPSTLARVSVGMSSDEVVRTLGRPRFVRRDADGTLAFAYRKHDRWCMVDVSFDPAERVRFVFYDHWLRYHIKA